MIMSSFAADLAVQRSGGLDSTPTKSLSVDPILAARAGLISPVLARISLPSTVSKYEVAGATLVGVPSAPPPAESNTLWYILGGLGLVGAGAYFWMRRSKGRSASTSRFRGYGNAGGRYLKIKHIPETDEWVVVWMEQDSSGRYRSNVDKTYYTHYKQDALDTAKDMARRAGGMEIR